MPVMSPLAFCQTVESSSRRTLYVHAGAGRSGVDQPRGVAGYHSALPMSAEEARALVA